MTESRNDGIEARLRLVERQCMLLRRLTALCALGVTVLVAMGQAASTSKVVQAELFQVVNAEGNVVATLGMDERVRSVLKFYESGKAQVEVGAAAGGGGTIKFMDANNQAQLLLLSAPGQYAGLYLMREKDRAGASLQVRPTESTLGLGDGVVETRLGVREHLGEILISAGPEKPSARLARGLDGEVSFNLWDKAGRVCYSAPERAGPDPKPEGPR